MNPTSLRRYRAERALREEFDGLQEKVLAGVRSKLRAAGASLDDADLEACYNAAWQGLYMALLGGETVETPAGWLVLVTFRRAIDEHRRRRREAAAAELHPDAPDPDEAGGREPDVASVLDDLQQLRQLMEGMRAGLSERERRAAALCYLQGLSREEAAAQMGIGERRMKRLMEGRGPEKPGVAAKLQALAETISGGRYCEQQASLMRAFAFGILAEDGERHRLALAHWRSCPACRAYVRSLRGLAAILPPVFLPGPLGGSVLGAAAGAAPGAGAGSGVGPALEAASGSASASGAGSGSHPGSGVRAARRFGKARPQPSGRLRVAALRRFVAARAPAGTAQPSRSVLSLWSAKVAAAGVLALGAGAGALALTAPPAHPRASAGGAGGAAGAGRPAAAGGVAPLAPSSGRGTRAGHGGRGAHRGAFTVRLSAGSAARPAPLSGLLVLREFGIERGSFGGASGGGARAGAGGGGAVGSGGPPSSAGARGASRGGRPVSSGRSGSGASGGGLEGGSTTLTAPGSTQRPASGSTSTEGQGSGGGRQRSGALAEFGIE